MKGLRIVVVGALIAMLAFASVGCYGSFSLTKKIYNWNGTVGDKYINSVVMWVLIIVPVYPATGFIDFWILNTIEFWTGSNPVAMQPGEKNIQTVKSGAKEYEITKSLDRIEIRETKGPDAGNSVSMEFDRMESTWYLNDGQSMTKVAQFDFTGEKIVKLFHPQGQTEIHPVLVN